MRSECTAQHPLDLAYASFGAFLDSHLALDLLASSEDAQLMVRELRHACVFHYFGLAAGKLARQRLKDRQKLRAYVTKAYRGDRRGVAHWRRIASLLWRAYDSFVELRKWAERAERIKLERTERAELYRKKERERLRVFRARKRKAQTMPQDAAREQ